MGSVLTASQLKHISIVSELCLRQSKRLAHSLKTLLGVILDWSDQQMKSLEGAVGEETAAEVAKGCKGALYSFSKTCIWTNLHGGLSGQQSTIVYDVTMMTSTADVRLLFDVLAGKWDFREALAPCNKSSILESYVKTGRHNPNSWKGCCHLAEWVAKRQTSTLSSLPKDLTGIILTVLSTQNCCALQHLPAQCLIRFLILRTNAVESHNQYSKASSPDIVKVALMMT